MRWWKFFHSCYVYIVRQFSWFTYRAGRCPNGHSFLIYEQQTVQESFFFLFVVLTVLRLFSYFCPCASPDNVCSFYLGKLHVHTAYVLVYVFVWLGWIVITTTALYFFRELLTYLGHFMICSFCLSYVLSKNAISVSTHSSPNVYINRAVA